MAPGHKYDEIDSHQPGFGERGAPVLRDWLGWLFAVLLLAIGSLSTLTWNSLEKRVSSLELYGSPTLRSEIATLRAQVMDLQRQLEQDHRTIERLDGGRSYYYEPNAGTPTNPRLERK